jgi:hypothetical protein
MQDQSQQQSLRTTWEALAEPGAYVDDVFGELFRVPAEALVTGASPIIQRVTNKPHQLVRVSEDPYCPIMKARSIAADLNIQPNF